MRSTLAIIAALLACSPVSAQVPASRPPVKSPQVQRREAAQQAQEKAAAQTKAQAAAQRAQAAAYRQFLITGVLPTDPVQARNILKMHDLRLRQAELQARLWATQPKGQWGIGFDPATGRYFNDFITDEESRRNRERDDRAFGSMSRGRAATGTVTPDGIGGYNVDIRSFPQ